MCRPLWRTATFVTLAAIAACAMPAAHAQDPAQDRMPPIPEQSYTDAQKKAAEQFAEGRGYQVRGPFVPLIRSPEVMLRAKAMGDYLRFKSTIPPRLSEMVILIVSREWTQQYEWVAHHDIAIKAGLPPSIADSIADGSRPAAMSADEEAAYDLSIEIQRTKRVSDATYAKAIARFGEQGVIDILGINGYYTLLAMTMNAARTGLPAGTPEPLERYPE